MGEPKLESQFFTYEEYLVLEADSEVRHEYFQGEVMAMAGGSRRHNDIIFNVGVAFRQQKDFKCNVYRESVKTEIDHQNHYLYPDVVVTCDPKDDDELTVKYPIAIFEVLSDSTEAYDRSEKFEAYKSIPSLQHYILISQKYCLVECFTRVNDIWAHQSYVSLEDELELSALALKIPLSEVYEGITFDEKPNLADLGRSRKAEVK